MIQVVLDKIRELADDVLFVANDDRLAQFGVRTVADSFPGTGTLGGIHAALVGAKHDYCLVVACDMPFLNLRLLKHMSRMGRTYDVLIPVTAGSSKQGTDGVIFQTLHAIYASSCLPAIEKQLAAGDNRIIRFFDDVVVKTIGEDECRAWDPELRSFLNLNTPESLMTAMADVGTAEPGKSA